jgi:hypothetical protein
MQLTCQKVYMNRVRCRAHTYGMGDLCRWHRIAHEFRSDLKDKPEWITGGLMFSVYPFLAMAAFGLWKFSRSPDAILLLFGLFTLGTALKHFADAVIARDYPLSQFAFWPRLLAFGMALEVASGLAGTGLVLVTREAALPLVRAISERPGWLTIGPSVVAAAAIVGTVSSLKMIRARILFRHSPTFNTMLDFLSFGAIILGFQPLMAKYAPVKPEAAKSFWAGALGGDRVWPLPVAYFIAFNVGEIINVRMRRVALDDEAFRKTIMISFPACTIPPVLAMLVTRYLLVWTGFPGPLPFIILTVAQSIPLCIMATRMIVDRAWGRRVA